MTTLTLKQLMIENMSRCRLKLDLTKLTGNTGNCSCSNYSKFRIISQEEADEIERRNEINRNTVGDTYNQYEWSTGILL